MNESLAVNERPGRRALVGALALALGLRLVAAGSRSLALDDFHTLHHAGSSSARGLLGSLALDNHPPLSFLLVRAVRGLLGDAELVLRLPALVAGIAAIALVARLARRLPGSATPAAAALLLAGSSLHVLASSDVRMYAWLALAVVGLLDALAGALTRADARGPARDVVAVGLWTTVGLHTHYHFLHASALIVLATVVGGLVARARLRPALLGLAAGALASLPWYATGFRRQLTEHALAPGGSDASLARLLESYVHLSFVELSLVGPFARFALLVAAALTVALAGIGAVRCLRRDPGAPSPAIGYPLVAAGVVLPAWTALAAVLVPRAGFEWRYLVGALGAWSVLVALGGCIPGAFARVRRLALGVALVAAVALSARVATWNGPEDYRGAVRAVLADARPGDAVLAADWQPGLFPKGIGWAWYAPRLGRPDELVRLAHDRDFVLAPDVDLARFERVFVVTRSLPGDAACLRSLRAEFPHERTRRFGRSVFTLAFSR